MNLLLAFLVELQRWRNRRMCMRLGHLPALVGTYPPLCPRCFGWPS